MMRYDLTDFEWLVTDLMFPAGFEWHRLGASEPCAVAWFVGPLCAVRGQA